MGFLQAHRKDLWQIRLWEQESTGRLWVQTCTGLGISLCVCKWLYCAVSSERSAKGLLWVSFIVRETEAQAKTEVPTINKRARCHCHYHSYILFYFLSFVMCLFEWEHTCARHICGSEDSSLEWFSLTSGFYGSNSGPQVWAAHASTWWAIFLDLRLYFYNHYPLHAYHRLPGLRKWPPKVKTSLITHSCDPRNVCPVIHQTLRELPPQLENTLKSCISQKAWYCEH